MCSTCKKCLWCPRLHSMGCHISISSSHWNMFAFLPLICFQFCFLNSGRVGNKRSAEGVSSGGAEKKCKSVLSVITLQAWGKLVFLWPGLFFSFRAAQYETWFQSMSELFILFVFAVDIPSLISCYYLFGQDAQEGERDNPLRMSLKVYHRNCNAPLCGPYPYLLYACW